MVHSETGARFDDVIKNQPSNAWISWVNIQMLYFTLSGEKVMAEPGTSFSVSVRFGRLFDMRLAPHYIFLLGLS